MVKITDISEKLALSFLTIEVTANVHGIREIRNNKN
jgi:hypothetical protein